MTIVNVQQISQAWAIPVGAVIAWPSEETPTSGGVWLECNGQTIPSQYKRLRELVGDKTPDYQGVFLRGYGSQAAVTNQGSLNGNSRQTYSSDVLGKVQGDAIRPIRGQWGGMFHDTRGWLETALPHFALRGSTDAYYSYPYASDPNKVVESDGYIYAYCSTYELFFGGQALFDNNVWVLKQPPKKYRLDGDNCSGGESCSGSSLSLAEEDDTESGEYHQVWAPSDMAFWSDLSTPGAHEDRPVNIAVRYFIKAR